MPAQYRYLAIALFSLLAACEANVSTNIFGDAGTSDAGTDAMMDADSEANDGGLCSPNAPCSPGTTCCDNTSLLTCEGGELKVLQECTPDETCDATTKACSCNPGAKRCTGDIAAEVCNEVDGGATWIAHPCPDGCLMGTCKDTACVVGSLDCSADSKSVVQCATTEDGAKQHFPALDCIANGYENGCKIPGVPSTAPDDYCANACNVVGVPLSAPLCSTAPAPLQCAVLLCDASGKSLIPDHEDCRGAGSQCTKNEQCISCFCNAGLCLGNFSKKCPAATMACPP